MQDSGDQIEDKFQIIKYSDIDLNATESLLKQQGLLLVDLGWFRAKTLINILNEEKYIRSSSFAQRFMGWRLMHATWAVFHLVPLALLNTRLIELHCIFINHCYHWEWKKLPNGHFRFTLL